LPIVSRSSSRVRPGVKASHQGRNLRVGPENLSTTARACAFAADEDPRNTVV